MPFVTDSSSAGYLGPNVTPSVLDGDAWTDFLHDVVCGVTGLANTVVFPRWQADPPNIPTVGVSWAAIGITSVVADWQPAVVHADVGNGHDALQRHESSTLLCSFYGPNCSMNAGLLRDGLFIEQNRAILRSNAVAVYEVGNFTRTPELFKQQWVDRIDVNVIFRREVRRDYPVLTLLSVSGILQANTQGVTIINETFATP